jgi:hypothetical protein
MLALIIKALLHAGLTNYAAGDISDILAAFLVRQHEYPALYRITAADKQCQAGGVDGEGDEGSFHSVILLMTG